MHERRPWRVRRPWCRMGWVAVRTGERTGGTTAKTVATTGGTVGSEEVATWHDAPASHRAGKRCLLIGGRDHR